jgi:hypothetical protein
MEKKTTLEEKETEKLEGTGKLLNPADGRTLSEAKYSLIHYNEITEVSEGTSKVEIGGGIEVYVMEANLQGFTGSHLTLEMEDGRKITGVFHRSADGGLALVRKDG